eukprot:COSAG02_NODE_784_length_17232_cov_12.871651_19_plen_111_part_00
MAILEATDSLQPHTASHGDAEPPDIIRAARDALADITEGVDGAGSTYGLDSSRDRLSLHSDTKERIKAMCAEMRTGLSGGTKARSGGGSGEKKQKQSTSFKRTVAAQQWI